MARLPRVAATVTPASLPPLGLDGLDSATSRLIDVPATDGGPHTWHVLDNFAQLQAAGATPVGTILCVHGNPTWSYLWRRLVSGAVDAAKAGDAAWRVIAVDQLDMGFSERTGTVRTLAQRVIDLGDLTDAIELSGPVVTLGHDWGGVVAFGWAVDHPELLAGTMALNTALHQDDDTAIPAPLRLALARGVLGYATVNTTAFLDTTLALGHPGLGAPVKDGYRAPYRTAGRRGGIGGFVADIPSTPTHESRPELDRIAEGVREFGKRRVPTLLLWGPRDPIFGDRYLDDLVDRVPGADVHRFEGAGHLLVEDVDYTAAVLAWLAERHVAERWTGAAAVPPVEPAHSATTPARAPMWAQLDVQRDSSATALVEMAPPGGGEPRSVSWRLLARRVDELASGFLEIGVRPGDRVSLLVPPGADLTAVLYACLRIGAVVVVADAGLGLRGLTRAVRGTQPDHIIGALPGLSAARSLGWTGQKISTTRLAAPLAHALDVRYSLPQLARIGAEAAATRETVPAAPAPSDPAAILFTSGSTGPAKGVLYTHDQLAAMRDALAEHYGLGTDTSLVAGFAPFALLGPALGCRSVTPDMDVTSPKTLTARAVAAAIAAADATTVFLSPAAVTNVVATADELSLAERAELERVELFLSAGAPISVSLLESIHRLMPHASAHTPYGMTEGLLVADISLEQIQAAAATAPRPTAEFDTGGVCVGRPTGPVDVRIAALDGAGAATGTPSTTPHVTGEIIVRAPHVKDHYDRLWLTDVASRRDTAADQRWHRTGDVGHLDAAGRLWVEGRVAHVIATAAGAVTPVATEQALERMDTVARAALVGVGPAGTAQLVAIIETEPAARRVALASPQLAAAARVAVQEAAGLRLAAVLVVPRMPVDIRHNSKIDRAHLARWADQILAGGRMVRP